MNWDQVQVSWKQVKGKFVFRRFRAMDDDGKSSDLLSAKLSRDGQRRAIDGLSPRRPRKAERVFVTYRLLIHLSATPHILTVVA